MDIWQKIFSELDKALVSISESDFKSGGQLLRKSTIRILGQSSILVQPNFATQLFASMTNDLDGIIEGEFVACRNELKKILASHGLVYDDLSKEIWLPDNSKFNQVYKGEKLDVFALDPISALVSKAVKAPGKNWSLIKRGLEVFGHELANELERNNIPKDKFNKEPDFGI